MCRRTRVIIAKMKTMAKNELFRELPSVDELIRTSALAALANSNGMAVVTDATRVVLARLREEISSGFLDSQSLRVALDTIPNAVEAQLRKSLTHSLRPVINATGVILHTNLGRAPLTPAAFDHIRETANSYSNLEFDLGAGERGKRDVHVEGLFRKLLAESSTAVSTIVVNNNAAAVLLALNTLAEGGEVIVSRGELVEIGGSFRIPDVMAKSGATLREVGTTNRTRIADYEKAISERTRLLLRVHRSNFEITGFTEQPSTEELVKLTRQRGIPVMEDLGSGALVDLEQFGIRGEPTVLDSLRMGMPFPTGLRALAASSSSEFLADQNAAGNAVEWAWAMNAAASVLGSVLAMVIAIQFGLTITLACGAAAYLLALAVLPALRAKPR